MVVAMTTVLFISCNDKEYSVDIGSSPARDDGSGTAPQPLPLVNSIERITIPNSDLSFNVVRVNKGTFTMGEGESQHEVTITKDFYIGTTEVTQKLYHKVMEANPSTFNYNDDYPVESVTWDEALEFCRQLKLKTGYNVSLPTEAQWEYAAHGGHQATYPYPTYAGSNNIGLVGWYWENSPHYVTQDHFGTQMLVVRHDTIVALKWPNELGIYDMSGNVREWCYDKYGELDGTPETDPGRTELGGERVFRGGACNDSAQYCRVIYRNSMPHGSIAFDLGFRVVINMN